ncbi:MAG: 50S ribosomal protein L22 [Muribaculaceae bacterium]|nr:50S ribosomal protein L22 [Muribaculaceae bacterium]MCI9055604.1 50S ribosomal protein L22 [Muribaculaceae bacterium]
MGVRKRLSADKRKEEQKSIAFAKLLNIPTSPRKMRLVADMIRGKEVFRALGILKFSNKEAAARVEKLLRSAVANWEEKNERKAESGELYVSTIYVNCAPMLKRLRPAPQGRGYRIRKRSNHVTIIVDTIDNSKNHEA